MEDEDRRETVGLVLAKSPSVSRRFENSAAPALSLSPLCFFSNYSVMVSDAVGASDGVYGTRTFFVSKRLPEDPGIISHEL